LSYGPIKADIGNQYVHRKVYVSKCQIAIIEYPYCYVAMFKVLAALGNVTNSIRLDDIIVSK